MALGLLFVLTVILLVLFLISIGLLVYKGGKLGEKNIFFGIIVIYALVLAFISFTALPTNYTIQRIVCLIAGILGIISIVFKKNNFKISRLILVTSMILSFFIMYV